MTMFKMPMMWCDDGGVVPGCRATAAEQVPHSKLALYNIRPEQVVPASSSLKPSTEHCRASFVSTWAMTILESFNRKIPTDARRMLKS